jgi:ferredoxin-type protein NapH
MDLPCRRNTRTVRTSQNKNFKNGKRNWIKYAIWAPWITIIIVMFLQAGAIRAVDLLYPTYYGISITGLESVIMFLAIASLIVGIALVAGKRAACHTICWMAPFMIIGRKIRNSVNWPALQLEADSNKCINCMTCTRNCAMSLNVHKMVQKQAMENAECIKGAFRIWGLYAEHHVFRVALHCSRESVNDFGRVRL